MTHPAIQPILKYVLFVALMGCSIPAIAGVELKAGSVTLPGVTLGKVSVTARSDGAQGLMLDVVAERVDLPSMGWQHVGVAMQGHLVRNDTDTWTLDTTVHTAKAPGAALADAHLRLVIDDSANTAQLDVWQQAAHIGAAMPLDQPTHVQLDLTALPAGWLQGVFASLWPGHFSTGTVDASMALDLGSAGLQAAGQASLHALGFDTPTGTLAAERLGATATFGLDSTVVPTTLTLDGNLHGGNLLLGPLYAQLPAHPVALAFDATAGKSGIAFSRLRMLDADALQLEGSLALGAGGDVASMDIGKLHVRLPGAYDRYGKGLLQSMGLPALATRGAFSGTLASNPQGLTSLSLQTDSLDLGLVGGQLGVRGLHGAVDWQAGQTRPATTLGWSSLNVYAIPNGAAQASLRTTNGVLALQKPLQVPVLDGTLSVREFAWQPGAADGKAIRASMVLTSVDMAALCRALGWPEFHGTLAGAVPSLTYDGQALVFGGGLALNVFDGFVDITRLSLEKPFSDAPVLAADIGLRQLDLALLTSVFDFGNITGRLDGDVSGLRMVSWAPVAFKANLLAGSGGKISQRAVNNLTSVGGGGIAGGLQGTVMKLFKNFGYRRIGIHCTLQAELCRMGGLDTRSGGYTIVEGSGLPRLNVIGHQEQVDWPTLLRRIQAATQGDGPVIN